LYYPLFVNSKYESTAIDGNEIEVKRKKEERRKKQGFSLTLPFLIKKE